MPKLSLNQKAVNNYFFKNLTPLKYEQINNQKKLSEIIEINYSEEFKKILFGTITKDELEKYVQMIKSIPKGTVSNETKIMYKKLKNELQQKHNMKINISPKVDSKTQRRVQCSIPHVDELFTEYPQFMLSKTTDNSIRGIQITPIIDSTKRTRNSVKSIKLVVD